MFETLIVSLICALLVSLAVNFLLSWQLRIRVGRLELECAELQTVQVRQARQRAAAASVEVRSGKMTKTELAQLAQLTSGGNGADTEELGWPHNIIPKEKVR